MKLVGGGTSGDALLTSTTSGHGATFAGTGTAKHGLNCTGAAASGGNAAGNGIKATGGAATTSAGGTAAAGFSVTGGAGAASTNGAASGATLAGGGTNTVASTADGLTCTGTSNGNGLTGAHAGTGLDLNATTSPPLQVNATQINGVSTGSVTTINANQGTTQPVNFDGSGATAYVKSDLEHWITAAPAALSANGYVQSMVERWLTDNAAGTPNALVSGDVQSAPDWAHIQNPTTVVNLSGTTVATVTNAVTVGTNNDKTGYDVSSLNGITTIGGKNIFNTVKYIAATTAGLLPSGAGTTTESWQGFDGSAAVDFTVDANGNRTAAVYH
jgi:hypothetical protein